jgi:hypothetical protein
LLTQHPSVQVLLFVSAETKLPPGHDYPWAVKPFSCRPLFFIRGDPYKAKRPEGERLYGARHDDLIREALRDPTVLAGTFRIRVGWDEVRQRRAATAQLAGVVAVESAAVAWGWLQQPPLGHAFFMRRRDFFMKNAAGEKLHQLAPPVVEAEAEADSDLSERMWRQELALGYRLRQAAWLSGTRVVTLPERANFSAVRS